MNKIRIPLLSACVLILSALLSGCGFHLREQATLPAHLSPMAIEGVGQYSFMHRRLRGALERAGIQVAEGREGASSVLIISENDTDRQVLAVNSRGKAAEYELTQSLAMELVDSAGTPLVKKQRLSVLRTYTDANNEVLGKGEEESEIRETMQEDLTHRILTRLQAQL